MKRTTEMTGRYTYTVKKYFFFLVLLHAAMAKEACCKKFGIYCGTHRTLKRLMPTSGASGECKEFVETHVFHLHEEFYVARE